jgi:hypothetical protein
MIPTERVDKILWLAAHAPSGDNAQPWRFKTHESVIDLYNIPGKDYSPYNFLERGSLFAHGAVVENILIASSSLGYAADIALFPKTGDKDCVAEITLSENQVSADPLAAYIETRLTNRKPYKKISLLPEHKNKLLEAIRHAGFGSLSLLEQRRDITSFAKTVSLSDRLIFEDKKIHDAIFGSIRWTPEEEKEQAGLYIKTLELPPPAQVLFKTLKNWKTLTLLNRIKISHFIASQSAKNYEASSAIGMLTIPADTPEDFVKAGRAFQRLWLTATELVVSLQPVTALAYLAQRIGAGEGGLSAEHASQVMHAQEKINALFDNPPGTVAMMFRVGYGPRPSAHSRKTVS